LVGWFFYYYYFLSCKLTLRDIIASYLPTNIMVENGYREVSLKEGTFIIMNADKAPSFDWCYQHPSSNTERPILELHQCKSSEELRKGLSPTSEVFWKQIMDEYKKMTDKKHLSWYEKAGAEPVFIFETNKPMCADHYIQCVHLVNGTKHIPLHTRRGRPPIIIEEFPKDLIIICKQNAASVIPQPFLHRVSLFTFY
jgi:hypothetical protein